MQVSEGYPWDAWAGLSAALAKLSRDWSGCLAALVVSPLAAALPGILPLLPVRVGVVDVHAFRGPVGLAGQQPRPEADNHEEAVDPKDQHCRDDEVLPPHFDRLPR